MPTVRTNGIQTYYEEHGDGPPVVFLHGAITVPSLLLYGEREPPTMARHTRYMAETIPTADARPIPDAGHHSHVDAPAFVVETLREFLQTSTDKK